MHAAGNDFVVVDGIDLPALNWPAVAQDLSARNTGVGSDGLMLIEKWELKWGLSPSPLGTVPISRPDCPLSPLGTVPIFHQPCCKARMFNPDGTEDFCADGILCVVAYLRKSGRAKARAFTLDTLWGPRRVRIGRESARAVEVTAEIGATLYEPAKIPAKFSGDAILRSKIKVKGRTLTISAVSTGTPHTIIFTDKLPDDAEFFTWAPLIERHPIFPEKTTVQWVVIESRSRVRSRVWERGAVGESLACGTGACAIAAVGHRLGLLSNRVTAITKGGQLTVGIDKSERLWISGKAVAVFGGEVETKSHWG